jgi:hypothetical protein
MQFLKRLVARLRQKKNFPKGTTLTIDQQITYTKGPRTWANR